MISPSPVRYGNPALGSVEVDIFSESAGGPERAKYISPDALGRSLRLVGHRLRVAALAPFGLLGRAAGRYVPAQTVLVCAELRPDR